MKDKEPKTHPLIKVGSALSALALAACQVGNRASPRTPEVVSTGTSPALIVEPPVGFEPSTPTPEGIPTLPGAETQTPTESAVVAFRAPTLEELIVPSGEGGPLSDEAQRYYNVMDSVKADIAQKVGVDPGKVKIRYWDNTGSQDDFGWMLYYQIEEGGVIWPLKPDGALADYPAYFDGEGQPDGTVKNHRMNPDYNNWVIAGENAAAIFGGTLPVIADSPVSADIGGETKLVYSRWLRPGGQPADYAKDFLQWEMTPGVSISTPTPESTPTSIPNEIVWDFKDPEVLPTKSFEYLTSTEFAQQVLDWEAQGRFPEVPDTAVPIKTIEIGLDTDIAFLKKYGFVSIYGFPEQSSNPVGYAGHLEKVPYILAGVWKTQYQGENAFFILKKWKNLDNSSGFEGYIYKTQSTNPKAITWELIDYGFGNEKRYPTGDYFLSGTTFSSINGFTNKCRLYFNQSGNPDSAFCGWYYENPDLVFNKELYYRWQRTGILSNYVTINNQKVPFIPIAPLTSNVFTSKQ